MNNKYAVIIAGGKGERFWPMSRLERPKHLLPIVGDAPLIKQTLDRLEGLLPKENIFIITNKLQKQGILEACPELGDDQVVAEPIGRDTAMAVALGLYLVKTRDPNAVFSILPADHVIHDSEGFRQSLDAAYTVAQSQEVMVTLGIQPTAPATGYGYIHRGKEMNSLEGMKVFDVQEFKEKPDVETAQEYVDSGNYYWNAGMFVWSVKTLSAALEAHAPSIYEAIVQLGHLTQQDFSIDKALEVIYPLVKKISIDYAVMEKADNVATIPAAFDWDDAGEWTALERHLEQDSSSNTLKGSAVVESASDNIVVSDDGALTVLLGVKDLVVVNTGDATLVCHKDKVQDIKKVVQEISQHANYQALT